MKPLLRNIFCVGLLLECILCGQPTLEPPTLHACPNETVTYTCGATQINEMQWILEEYVPEKEPIKFTAGQIPDSGMAQMNYSKDDRFFADLTKFIRTSVHKADMTTNLAVITRGIKNETNITCLTVAGKKEYHSSTTLYIAGVPYWKHDNITYKTQETYFTAVLKLGDMFGEGGVPIDHYIIQVDNDTELETTSHTFSFNISYHTTLFVNISAHNCAGYSDFVMLKVHYTQGVDYATVDLILSVIVPAAIGILIVIGSISVLLLLLFKRFTKARSKSRRYIVSAPRVTDDDGEMVEIQHVNGTTESSVEYKLPVTDERLKSTQRDSTGQYRIVVHEDQHTSSQNIIGEYAEIRLQTRTALPPPTTDDTVQYSKLVHCEQKPPISSCEIMLEDEEVSDMHPLDKRINGHLILLQLVPVQPHWHSFGSAAGLGEEILDMINAELTEDSERLAEVVFRWLEQRTAVRWTDVALLCEETGFNDLSEDITKAYETGVLPVEDSVPVLDHAEPPPLPPRDDDDDIGWSPPPPLSPPLSCYTPIRGDNIPYSDTS